MSFSFTLQKYTSIGSRHTCPACGKLRVFVRYVNTENGELLGDHVGRCNREVECGYHYKPVDHFKENPSGKQVPSRLKRIDTCTLYANISTQPPSYIPHPYLEKSINQKYYEGNHFIQYLKRILGGKWQETASLFYIGCANHWIGSVVFWQIDCNGEIRSGKIMGYNPATGKRIKNRITWVHSELKKKGLVKDFNLRQCLFGEHQLIKEPSRPVGIVESEETAIIASAYMPELTWMASGSLNGISPERILPLKNNSIILYPDIKGFEKWNSKADELRKNGFRITVSDLLEKADFVSEQERAAGFDLADYLPRLPLPMTKLEAMGERNPQLKELVKRFDLI